MMQTHANYSRPFPDHWFPALARLCRETVQNMQTIGQANLSLTAEEKQDINEYFHAEDYNVALIGEEITGGSADLVGGWLYTINNLLDGPFVSPVTIAPVARAAIETSAQIAYLNAFEPIERCFWAMRAVTDKIHYEKERDLVPGVFPRLKEATKVHTDRHRGTKFEFPGNTTLVRETLKVLGGYRMYKETSAYTHQHAWTAYKHSNYVMYNPLPLELRTIRFVLDALAAADYAARSFINFRNTTKTATAYSNLDILLGRRKAVHDEFVAWMTENNVALAP
ncbi:hypothetical protein [Corynebacterium accolens]|uniref:hypothetical protein n=1 Tax=Corynebacterium accolens TaxID=38284 RepID=UPI002543417C|nr:hypothetical protein [Corynebacterium accolens]MDK4279053.1 hypothetical protein [Corynebacterium accolens]MDK8821139.1 hypothetical protein [Corynebacterium accolens]